MHPVLLPSKIPHPQFYLQRELAAFDSGPHLADSMVGAGRFERPTPCAQGRCATRLRYAPTSELLPILTLSAFPSSGLALRGGTPLSELFIVDLIRASPNRVDHRGGADFLGLAIVEIRCVEGL